MILSNQYQIVSLVTPTTDENEKCVEIINEDYKF
jgi:uncharacterized protein YfbU (UPF0304 family)